MREISTLQDTLRQEFGKNAFWILEIDFTSGTKRYSDRDIIIGGQLYKGILEGFSENGKIISVGIDAGDVFGISSDFVFRMRSLYEDPDRFSGYIVQNSLDGLEVRVGLVFKPETGSLVYDDIIWYHSYIIDTYIEDTQIVEIQAIDLAEFYLRRFIGRVITSGEFPGAPSESFGKIMPLILGQQLDCPCIPVVLGARTLLSGILLPEEDIISVVDLRDFPDPGIDGYVIQVEKEFILVRALDRDNNTFGIAGSPCLRGYNDSDAVEHLDGIEVHELKAEYIYLIAGHKLHGLSNVRVGGNAITSNFDFFYDDVKKIHYLRFTERPISKVYAPGSEILRIDGSLGEDGVTKLWDFSVGGDNNAIDAEKAFDAEGLFTFAQIDKGHQRLSIDLGSDLSNGEIQYGRFKKLRLGVEYFCSKRWGDGTYPYIALERDGSQVGDTKFLQRPAEEDSNLGVDDHDHQEQSDWSIGDSRDLFSTEEDLDEIEKSDSSGYLQGGQYWSEYEFAEINKSDGSYRIQRLRFYVLFDGKPLTATLRVTLANNTFREAFFNSFSVPEEKFIVLDVSDVGGILISDIVAGKVKFRVEGTYDAGSFVSLDGRLELDTQIWIKGQEFQLGQTQEQNRTELIGLNGEGATSRVVQVMDFSVLARDYDGFGFFGGDVGVVIDFNNSAANDDTFIYILNIWFDIEYQPLVESLALGDVLVDVEGYETDGSVYYSQPVDILRYLLLGIYGGIGSGYIDDDSFNDVRGSIDAIAPIVGRWIGERLSLKEIVQSLVSEINCVLIFEGRKFKLLERRESPDPLNSSVDLDDDYFNNEIIRKERSSLMQVENQIAIYYNRLPGNDKWFRRVLERNDDESQAQFWGLRRETFNSWWHGTNKAAVEWLADFIVRRNAWKYSVVNLEFPLNMINSERGDIGLLTHERSGLIKQAVDIIGTRITGKDRMEIRCAFYDSSVIFETANCRVEVDRSGGRWMRFYSMGELLAILYDNGDFHFKYTSNMAGTSMLKGNDPGAGDLFVCHNLTGAIYGVAVPLPQSVGQCWLPMIVIGSIGVVRLYGSRVKTGVANLSETINGYVEWSEDNWVKLAPNGKDVVAKFEAAGGDDTPGIWTYKGDFKSRAFEGSG